MGDILFHFTPEEERLMRDALLRRPLSDEQKAEARTLFEMEEINKHFAKPDAQKSADGYGIEDRSKL